MTNPFAEIDEKYKSEGNPFAGIDKKQSGAALANKTLNEGVLKNATPEQTRVINSNLSPQELERITYKITTEQKYGKRFTDQMLNENMKLEYGADATFQTANAHNLKAAKWSETKDFDPRTGTMVSLPYDPAIPAPEDISGYVRPEKTIGNSLGSFLSNLKVAGKMLPEHFTSSTITAGLTPAINPMYAPLPSAETLDSYYKNIDESSKEIEKNPFLKKMRESARLDFANSRDSVLKYKGSDSKPLVESFKAGDFDQFGSDLADAFALEIPNFVTLASLASINPVFGAGYAGGSTAGNRYADGIFNGETPQEASSAASIHALAEVGLEMVGSSGMIASAMGRRAKGEVLEGCARRTLELIKEPLTEMGTQGIQNLADGKPIGEGMMEAGLVGLGFGAGVNATMNPISLGDATRINKTHTLEEIDEKIKNDPVLSQTPERAELARENFTNPTEQNNEALNRDIFEQKEEVGEGGVIETESKEVAKITKTDEKASKKEPPVIPDSFEGISRKHNNTIREAIGLTKLTPPETRAQVEVMQEAINGGYHSTADSRANDVISGKSFKGKRPAPLTDVEVGGMLVRKAEISNDIKALYDLRSAAEESNDTVGINEVNARIDMAERNMDRLTSAVDMSVSENARGMAMMARLIDRKSFKLVDVINVAKTVKKSDLTRAEKDKLHKITSELELIQKLGSEKIGEITDAEAKVLEEFANDAVSEMLSSIRTRRTKAEIKEANKQIRKNMAQLGYRMNDITGITVVTANEIKKLALNYIHDGALTLKELTDRFMAETEGFTEHDFMSAIGGRVTDNANKALSEVDEVFREMKKQANLTVQVKNAFNQIFDPINPVEKSSKEVTDLRNKLNLLRSSVVSVERNDQKVNQILDTLAEVERMLDLKYRKIKVIHKKTPDLVEAEKMLNLGNKELRAQDKIAVLEELLRTDSDIQKKHVDRSETSQRLEEYRTQIMGLKDLIAKKNAPKKEREAFKLREQSINEQIDILTTEVEQFIRVITEKKATKIELVEEREKRSMLREGKRDQDTIADLFESIRNKTPKNPKKTKVKKDPYGYKEMIQNIRKDMQSEEWYQEWKQTSDELKKNEISKANIKDMERRISERDFEGFITPKQILEIKNEELRANKLKEHQLKQEINSIIRSMRKKTFGEKAHDIWNIPRNAKLSVDVGHIWRQGGVILSNPTKLNAIKFTEMSFKNFKKENADAWDLWVLKHKDYESARKAGVRINEKGELQQGVERMLDSELLEQIPVIGEVFKASARTQITSLNVLRLQWWSTYIEANPNATDVQLKEAAVALNVMTGYGQGKTVSSIAPALDHLITSTRFTASRFQAPFLVPYALKKGNTALAKRVAEDQAWFLGTRISMGLLAAAFLPDVEWGMNPDHHTFGKLVVDLGNGYSRVYDFWSGLEQVIRTARQISTGEKAPVTALADSIAMKASPQWSFFRAVIHGKDWRGNDINRLEGGIRGLTPISVEGAIDSYIGHTGIIDGIMATGMDVVGFGTYLVETDSLDNKMKFSDRNKSDDD